MRLSNKAVAGFATAALLVGLVTSPALAVHLANPNQLVDPGFESPITTDGPPFVGSWEGFSSDGTYVNPATSSTATMPRNGAQSLELVIDNVANGFAGAFQDVQFSSSLVGLPAWFSGYHKLVGDTGGSEIRIEWRDSVANTEITRKQITPSPAGSDYEEFILSDVIPAGADTARVVYAIQSFGGALNQQMFVDDLNFNYAPEPTTASLLALTSLALAGARRRR